MRSSRVGKCRYSVPIPTLAARAISSREAETPSRSKCSVGDGEQAVAVAAGVGAEVVVGSDHSGLQSEAVSVYSECTSD